MFQGVVFRHAQARRELNKTTAGGGDGGTSAPDGIKSVENRSLYMKPNNMDSTNPFFFSNQITELYKFF